MPSTGTPSSYTIGSMAGAPGTWTLLGPPLKITPVGRRAASSSAVIVCGHDLAVDVGLAHPPGDELGVLRPEVDDQDRLDARWASRHGLSGPSRRRWARCSDLPSVCSAGATMTSAFWNSFSVS